MNITFLCVAADRAIKCSLCETVVFPGELFWRGSSDGGNDLLWVCTSHIPVNSKGFVTCGGTDEVPYHTVRPDCIDLNHVVAAIRDDWSAIYGISADTFEELVCDRLIAMGLQAIRVGRANKKDGGIDIVFWTPAPFRSLGAVQVKHHGSPGSKTGPDVIRDFAGVISAHPFNLGMVVTNTEFTSDAKWFAQEKSSRIQLRSAESIRKWLSDDFSGEAWNARAHSVELCPGMALQLPQFL